jgi:peptide deformylase
MSDDIISFNTEEQVQKQLNGLHGIPENVYQLVPETHPILSQVMPEWDFKNPPMDATELASALVETCRLHRGYGLSANQCGLPYRVFVMGYDKEYVAFFNPSIVLASKKETHMAEGCLSFPFLGLYITRPEEIAVTYQDYTGEWKQATLTGISARCFQHELDHMNGIVYTKKVKPMALQSGMQKRNKIMKKLKLK